MDPVESLSPPPFAEPGRACAGTHAPTDPAQRLDWLFRDSTRRGLVHPLLALIRDYRAGDCQ